MRHPEKRLNTPKPSPPRPPWLKARAVATDDHARLRSVFDALSLVTVCEEAACPNLGTCWRKGHATFMVLGSVCTRGCAFCYVTTGAPQAKMPDADEPSRLAQAAARLALSHVVVTSVNRDDLKDGGAGHFANCIRALRRSDENFTVEVLTPDFLEHAEPVIDAGPDVFNHNLETVPRLYRAMRPGAVYYRSLKLLDRVKSRDATIVTKSGLMLGLGESRHEILQVMDDLRAAGVESLTLGQYLQPTPRHAPVARFLEPREFSALASAARAKGFALVSASPLTRSSFHAAEDFAALRRLRRRA